MTSYMVIKTPMSTFKTIGDDMPMYFNPTRYRQLVGDL